jgi:hypothetical protein
MDLYSRDTSQREIEALVEVRKSKDINRIIIELIQALFSGKQAQCSALGVTFPAGLFERARFPFRTLIIGSGAVI